jgi:histidinol phosphatase-like enzyme (inositol monophosphatase family)
MTPSLKTLLEVAIDAGYAGGRRTLAYFNNSVAIERKNDSTPVTLADKEAEATIRAKILHAFPDHSILGEEEGSHQGSNPDYRWIIDPLDGTKSFIHGVPLYGTMIGLEVKGKIEVGVIYLPALDDMVYASTGHGCYWNGRRTSVSKVDTLDKALMLTTSPTRAMQASSAYSTLCEQTWMQRGWGDCYGYVLVATGRAEIMIDPKMMPWDAGPLPVILQEAGGRFTDWKGNVDVHAGQGVATNGLLHDPVVAALSR